MATATKYPSLVRCFLERKNAFLQRQQHDQIDYFLVRYRDQMLVTEAKVISYEAVSSQHCPLTCTIEITPPKQKYDERCGTSRIKWW
ncbi:hypothetical protein Y032_0127g1394 [Ancylostoma ceylanicum]|nr:hypothetical protein Y032_0127g1394 [Ancylostoma ceylanicum]